RPPVARTECTSGARARGDVSPPGVGSGRDRGVVTYMAQVVGVVFQPGAKVYSFDPAGLDLRWDQKVICQTARGRELGRVVQAAHEVPDAELIGPLKKVLRRAGDADEQQVLQNRIEAK